MFPFQTLVQFTICAKEIYSYSSVTLKVGFPFKSSSWHFGFSSKAKVRTVLTHFPWLLTEKLVFSPVKTRTNRMIHVKHPTQISRADHWVILHQWAVCAVTCPSKVPSHYRQICIFSCSCKLPFCEQFLFWRDTSFVLQPDNQTDNTVKVNGQVGSNVAHGLSDSESEFLQTFFNVGRSSH